MTTSSDAEAAAEATLCAIRKIESPKRKRRSNAAKWLGTKVVSDLEEVYETPEHVWYEPRKQDWRKPGRWAQR